MVITWHRAAFGISDENLPVFNVIGSEFQDLTHSHATTGHEFEHKPVPGILCFENHFIYDIFFQDFPMDRPLFFEDFS